MHSTEVGATSGGTPQFLNKLWKLVEDTQYDNLISWGPGGTTFIIRNQLQFAKEVLPMYFKHSNMASFIRQLNMYGFRKIANIEQGGLKSEKDEVEFQHPYFVKGQEYSLPLIKRKIGKAQENTNMSPDTMSKMIEDFTLLRSKQETLDTQLANLKKENEAVWREVASLRQKHAQQQTLINRMIQFLVSMFRSSNRISNKRKIPLMFTEPAIKREKNTFYSLDENNLSEPNSPATGPVIRDVTNSVGIDGGNEGIDMMLPIDPQIIETTTTTETTTPPASPKPTPTTTTTTTEEEIDPLKEFTFTEKKEPVDEILTSVLDSEPSTSTFSSVNNLNFGNPSDESTIAIPTKSDIAEHVEGVQGDLDSLRELLSNANYYFDLDVINFDEMFPAPTSLPDETLEDKNEITGNEVMKYNPSLMELADEESEFFNCGTNGLDLTEFDEHVKNIIPRIESINPEDEELNTPDPILPNVSIPKPSAKK